MKTLFNFIILNFLALSLISCNSSRRTFNEPEPQPEPAKKTFLSKVSSTLKNKIAQYTPYTYGEIKSPQTFTKDQFNIIGNNCDESDNCKITLNVSKTSNLRPFFMVNLKAPTQTCNTKAYVKSIVTIASEIVEINHPEILKNYSYASAVSKIQDKCNEYNKGYICDKLNDPNVSLQLYNYYSINNDAMSLLNQKIIKLNFLNNSNINEVCLDELILPSKHRAVTSAKRQSKNKMAVAQIELTF